MVLDISSIAARGFETLEGVWTAYGNWIVGIFGGAAIKHGCRSAGLLAGEHSMGCTAGELQWAWL